MSSEPYAQADPTTRYITAGRVARLMNRVVAWLVRRGVNLAGARILEVRGRTSGQPRTTPVNLLRLDGADYLVAPRGQTQWVRNLRVAGEGVLHAGRRHQPFTAVELPDDAKPPVLQAYIQRWWFEIGAFFEGIDRNATREQLEAIAPGFPVFAITTGPR